MCDSLLTTSSGIRLDDKNISLQLSSSGKKHDIGGFETASAYGTGTPVPSLFGTGQFPGLIDPPFLMPARSVLSVTVTPSSIDKVFGGMTERLLLVLTFSGRKIFHS